MTETEQLRKELNELRERVAVLESKQVPTAKFFGVTGGGKQNIGQRLGDGHFGQTLGANCALPKGEWGGA